MRTFALSTKVWLYPGKAGWNFSTIDEKVSDEIKKTQGPFRRGFGSIPVNVTVGRSTWRTSIFPEKSGTFLLPIKKSIRMKEDISVGDKLNLEIEILD